MERIYPCPWCESKVSRPQNLKRHVQLRHKKLKCSNCGKSLTKCEDFNAVGQAFACISKRRNK